MTAAESAGGAREHILVCLSTSPSNSRIINTAARMAGAFGGTFTALYVQTSGADRLSEADRRRLRYNMDLAEKLGAAIVTVQGDDVSYQIVEFARLSGVTRIVIGRSYAARRHFWSKPTLTERLIAIASDLDIHIIPDSAAENKYREKKKSFARTVAPSAKDLLVTALILAAATAIGSVFRGLGFTEANIITVYLLGVLLTSLFTKSQACSVAASLASVLVFNFFFTEPRLTLHAYEAGYAVTFAIMLFASLLTGSLANRLKNSAKQSAQSAFRSRVLFDTNQMLQKAKDDADILRVTATQLTKLFDRDVVVYPEESGALGEEKRFSATPGAAEEAFFSEGEREVAEWAFENKKRAGRGTDVFKKANGLYLSIRINEKVYGVVGVHIGAEPLDSFENSMFVSMLGECAMAIDNYRNAREREQAALLARNEQIRANLLRTISHDLRTPLTSISGNAGYLLSNYKDLDDETRTRMFTDIYDDSMWLISLVENLLSVTRIEDGRMNICMTTELVDEVIEEALRHVNPKCAEHKLSVDIRDEMLLVRVDARLIVQVLINLVNNAVKYTPPGSSIAVTAERAEGGVAVSVADDGPGIPDAWKEKVFEMFFTGENRIADGRRSLGLGLPLCKSILSVHGSEISLADNAPHGCVFRFLLPVGGVKIDE